jgi:hypothetical protein
MHKHYENININGLHGRVGDNYTVDKEAAFFYEIWKLALVLIKFSTRNYPEVRSVQFIFPKLVSL